MKIFVDISKEKIISTDDEKRDIYKADNYADKIKVYCTEAPIGNNTWYLSLSAKLSNGRVTRSIDADGGATEVEELGKHWFVFTFTLSKHTFTLCDGLTTFYLLITYVKENVNFKKEKTIGSFTANILNTEELNENILIMDGESGNVIVNFQSEINDLRDLVAKAQAGLNDKQNVSDVVLTNELDNVQNRQDILAWFFERRNLSTRTYRKWLCDLTAGDKKLIEILELNKLTKYNIGCNDEDTDATLNFVLINSNNEDFRLAIYFLTGSSEDIKADNYVMLMSVSSGGDLTTYSDTGWTNLNLLKKVNDIPNIENALTYNNIGLLWVSNYDVETGDITYILNPNFDFTIDDSKLEDDGTIDWYVRPKGVN